MKTICIQNMHTVYFGTLYLTAAVKKSGHSIKMIIINNPEAIAPKICVEKPDLISFSVTTVIQ